ncbi:hypothetical protein STRTUCAR8_01715 [Streptomyces turgidiscabies Car8]|uniref:Uncharacterized protein n=1 Tax=Streptomyces turgidiscabies (strain Car8) TaxID=698760 RepID=L7F4Z2_STRT8|nr:hypothetical protein STRTUCAR8_01715 [Streptomyces turgidiscabies Car8]
MPRTTGSPADPAAGPWLRPPRSRSYQSTAGARTGRVIGRPRQLLLTVLPPDTDD